jgi:hypothetical protein
LRATVVLPYRLRSKADKCLRRRLPQNKPRAVRRIGSNAVSAFAVRAVCDIEAILEIYRERIRIPNTVKKRSHRRAGRIDRNGRWAHENPGRRDEAWFKREIVPTLDAFPAPEIADATDSR